MASPYFVDYVVPDGTGSLTYNRKCYKDGETIKVPQPDICCFMDEVALAEKPGKCFPMYCLGADGYPTAGYRVPILVPAGGAVTIATVPTIEGCAPANMVCFHYCSPCLYVGYNADPITDPADADGQLGGGADPNPTCRDLIDNGEVVETIHMTNPTDSDVIVMLSYYS